MRVRTSPSALELQWPATSFAREYFIRRRMLGESSWGAIRATLPAGATGYVDTTVSEGGAYEYEVELDTAIPAPSGRVRAYGYVYAGINVPFQDYKGKVLLIVDSSVAGALSAELSSYERNLVGAGWSVKRREVSRAASVVEVKTIIHSEYTADPFNVRSVVLVGHVPVPYSGNIAPDLHASHQGAWPADVYYAEMDGSWTDATVNITSVDSDDNHNYPGDGKFDQSQIPSPVELEIGRIDFWNLPSFAPKSEIDLLRSYFRKNHDFRHRQFTAARRGLIRDNFGDLDGDAPAVDAWRHFPQFFGSGNIQEVGPGAFFPTLAGQSFLWAYGCGGGGYNKADGVGTTMDFALSDPKAVFLILHGSYFGDWNNADNFLRAGVATPNFSLASIWSGLPHWFMHPMGLGTTIGYATRSTQNNVNDYKSHQNFGAQQVHISLIGDPTLEMFPVVPPSNLTATAGGNVNLDWSSSTDENILGYHLYYSTSTAGPFQRITGSPVGGNSYSHAVPSAGTHHYMVRAIKLEQTGSGTFFNASQGAFVTVTTDSGGATPPTVQVTLEDGDVGESGSNAGTFKVSRSPAGDTPLAVEFLVGGTAQNGIDYAAIGTSITIPGGATDAQLIITPISDGLIEAEESITIQLRPSRAYVVGQPSAGFLQIKDAPAAAQPPAVSQIAPQTIAANSDSGEIPFVISDPDTPSESLNVRGLSSDTQLVAPAGIILGGAGANRHIRIVPVAGAAGVVTITIAVSDGVTEISSNFEVTVTPLLNLPPVADGQSIEMRAGASAAIILSGSDPENAAILFAIRTSPAHGILTGVPPNLSYHPAAGFAGTDSFAFVVNDGQVDSAAASVSITVTSENRAPVALAQSLQGTEDAPVAISLGGTDPDGDALTFELVTGPTRGVLTGREGNFQYMPRPDFFGQDTFSFRVGDGATLSAAATVAITILPANDPPVAAAQTVALLEDQTVPVILGGSDADGDALSYQIVSTPSKGQISGVAPNLVFTPAPNANGIDAFTFKVSDAGSESSVATISITITPVNDPPIANSQELSIVEDEALPLTIGGSDADGDPLTYRIVTAPVKGQISGSPPALIYTPAPNITGSDSLTWVLNDGTDDSTPATITIEILPRNDPPQVSSIPPQSTRKNLSAGPYTFSINDDDRPINELIVHAISSDPSIVRSENLTISGNGTNRALVVMPERNAVGSSTITVSVDDGETIARSAFVFSTTNTPPVAGDDALSRYAGPLQVAVVELLKNDADADGDPLQLVSVSPSEQGIAVTLSNGIIGYAGIGDHTDDSFSYVIADTSGALATATVRLSVAAYPQIESIARVAGGTFSLTVRGAPSALLDIQASADANAWLDLGQAATDTAGRGEFIDTASGNQSHRFYRLKLP